MFFLGGYGISGPMFSPWAGEGIWGREVGYPGVRYLGVGYLGTGYLGVGYLGIGYLGVGYPGGRASRWVRYLGVGIPYCPTHRNHKIWRYASYWNAFLYMNIYVSVYLADKFRLVNTAFNYDNCSQFYVKRLYR